MIDCSNADMRDQLPELVNGRLDGERLSTLQAHLADCDLCRDEVLLLERTRAVLIVATPRINTANILQALPIAGARTHRRAFDWRIAASIAVLAVGGGSAAMMYQGWSAPMTVDSVAMAGKSTSTPAASSDESELSVSGDLSGLTDDQLRALLGKVERIETLPAAEGRVAAPMRGVVSDAPGSHGPSGAQ